MPMPMPNTLGGTADDRVSQASIEENNWKREGREITAAAPLPKSRATHSRVESTPAEAATSAVKSGWQVATVE